MTKTRAKAIKLYWNIAKERCPFHEEEMVNSFLEGFIDCAEYLLPQNAELKSIADFQQSGNMSRYFELKRQGEQLTKAKELLKRFLGLGNLWDLDCKDYFPLRKETEQFLKDQEEETCGQ